MSSAKKLDITMNNKICFKGKKTFEVITHARQQGCDVLLVKDEGVYLMAAARTKGKRLLAYRVYGGQGWPRKGSPAGPGPRNIALPSALSFSFFLPNGHCRPRTGRDRSPDINLRAFSPFSALQAGIKRVWRRLGLRRSPNVAVPLRLQGFALPVSSPVRTAQGERPLAAFWGDGTTSSSDGQNFRTGNSGRYAGQVNPKYGQEPGRQFYTHISDQYSPFYTCIISRVRDSTHVLDGLLYHESDLEIREHYTDTAGFTDHVFALMHLLGFAFCPRIRDLHDKKLFIKGKADQYSALQSLISTTSLNLKEIEIHWREVLRLATSIKQGTVTASLMLKKLASYPKQNGLAKALREIGRIERTLFMLDWFRDPALRRRVQAGLNKGEARNALARAVFMHRLGEIRDRKPENQSYRASGLTLLTAAISLWNTVYMERSVDALKRKGLKINEQLLSHLSPLGWEHINLTGDYIWKSNRIPASGKFRRLRRAKVERSKNSLNVQ